MHTIDVIDQLKKLHEENKLLRAFYNKYKELKQSELAMLGERLTNLEDKIDSVFKQGHKTFTKLEFVGTDAEEANNSANWIGPISLFTLVVTTITFVMVLLK